MKPLRTTASVLASALLVACSGGGDPTPPIDPGPFDRAVASTDVSILYPLTAATALDDLIPADAEGAWGELLPETLPGTSPPVELAASLGWSHDDLRLVALRLDPCSARDGCSPEIRAIFQPIRLDGARPLAADAALHVFYAVPDDELLLFLKQLLALKKAYGVDLDASAPLDVHPILAATGLRGPFARGLEGALLSHVGLDRIARVTAMAHSNLEGDVWAFALFERRGAGFAAATIVDTEYTSQVVGGSPADEPEIGGLSDRDTTPSLPQLGALAVSWRPAQPTTDERAGFAQALEAQDPTRHTSEDLDCVSCHVAEGARRVGVELYGLTPTAEFTSTRSLAYRRDGKAMTDLHAFSYLGAQVSIMRRTSHESAVVADTFQDMLLGE